VKNKRNENKKKEGKKLFDLYINLSLEPLEIKRIAWVET
jgi:hypothetical protein